MGTRKASTYTSTVFKLTGRKEVENLRTVKFEYLGVILNSKKLKDKITFDESVNIDKDIFAKNIKPLECCINLGNYLNSHPSIIKKLVVNYLYRENRDKLLYERSVRFPDYDIESFIPITIPDEFKYIDVDKYDVDLSKENVFKEDVYSNETLLKKITNFFKYCGISQHEYENFEKFKYIPLVNMLHIFDFCIDICKAYKKLINGQTNVEISMKYIVSIDTKSDRPRITKHVTNLESMIYLNMISYYLGDYPHYCKFCNDLFFGRKNKLFCCENCSDLYNKKYIRRKERKCDKENIER